MRLNLYQKLHMVHRCWRLRFKSEVSSIRYVREADLAGCTLLDIGANKGVFSIYMSRAAGPDGSLIAFEAQPELGDHLRAVKQSFGLDNMTLVNLGLSSQPGVLTMRRPEAGSGRASFHIDATDGPDVVDIPVITLDDYIEEHRIGAVAFIKCDVEGHELQVFTGAKQLLLRDQPTLLFECHDDAEDADELFGFLAELGYDGYFLHVTRSDHASILRKGRGHYVPFEQRAGYEHVHPTLKHRNYIFLARGDRP